jgi:hypothetical protein
VVDARLTFVDTEILAYAHDRSETARQPVARALLEVLWRDRAGVLSTQALQSSMSSPPAGSTRRWPARPPASWLCSTPPGRSCRSTSLILAASELEERHTLSLWDALVVEPPGGLGRPASPPRTSSRAGRSAV